MESDCPSCEVTKTYSHRLGRS